MTGRAPEKGLRLLHDAGIVASWWPEMAAMAGVPQSKEHHPEGDVWEHTLATFAHRKVPDLVLSLGLLLHDAGKPRATPQDGKRSSPTPRSAPAWRGASSAGSVSRRG